MRASRSTRTTRSTTSSAAAADDRGPPGDPAAPLRGRARLVRRAPARERAPEADPADEHLLLAEGRDPRAPLPRARPGRPLRLPPGDGAGSRPRPRDRRGVQPRHRRRESGRALHPRPPRARLRGAHGSPLLLPRHGRIRPVRPGRARSVLGRRPCPAPLEHVIADPVRARRRRVLLTGAGGQLGRALAEAFADDELLPLSHDEWDVTLPAPAYLPEPELVLHAAAWTDVDGAEDDAQGATAVNVGGTKNVAELGAPLVYFSTDYVFDGAKREPYVESDGPNPLSAYGRSKLLGEAAAGEGAWIVRSSWLFGPTGHNFVRTMLRLGAERDEVAVVDDQRGSPTYVGHLAEATRELVELEPGLWHLAADGDCTWAELAEAIFAEAGVACRVRRISSDELARPAPRPAYSVLRSERAGASRLPHWRDGLRACLERLAQ